MYRLQTEKGYDFFEASSSLQKAIRRGDEDVALYFMVELFNSGFDNYVWKRLRIITSEDVGLAEPFLPATIQALYSAYLDQKKASAASGEKSRPERMFITHATLLLVRARKSRLCDWVLMKYWQGHDLRYLDVPDYALDKHNKRGKALGRGLDHFFDEGSRLENHVPQDGELAARIDAREIWKQVPKSKTFETKKKVEQADIDYEE